MIFFSSHLNSLSLRRVTGQNDVVKLLVELHSLNVVKHGQQVGLDGVGVTSLTKDLQKGGVRHEEESWEQETLLLQVSVGRKK